VFESCIQELCDCLANSDTALVTMQILLKIAAERPQLLVDHFNKIRFAGTEHQNTTALAAQVLATAGRTNKV